MNEKNRQTMYLLRHAKAEPWLPGVNDFERALNERGSMHMQRLATWAGTAIPPPDVVLCSPSARTRQTLEPFLQQWPELRQSTTFHRDIYEATTGMLHSLAGAAFRSTNSVMMVGHNPGFEYLALDMLRDEDSDGITKMPTGTLAVIDFENGWDADSGRGVLRHWVRRKHLEKLLG